MVVFNDSTSVSKVKPIMNKSHKMFSSQRTYGRSCDKPATKWQPEQRLSSTTKTRDDECNGISKGEDMTAAQC